MLSKRGAWRRLLTVAGVSLAAIVLTPLAAQAGNVYAPSGCNTTYMYGWASNGGDPTGPEWEANCALGYKYEVSSQLVLAVQRLSTYEGCNAGTFDGLWGTNTYNAVVCIQRKVGEIPVDGVVGQSTWGDYGWYVNWNNFCTVRSGYRYCAGGNIAEQYVQPGSGGGWSWVLNKAGSAYNHMDNRVAT